MELFFGICMALMSQLSVQVSAQSIDPSGDPDRVQQRRILLPPSRFPMGRNSMRPGSFSRSMAADDSPSSTENTQIDYKINVKGQLPKSIAKPSSIKFVVKDGRGNVEKFEQVCIPVSGRLPGKVQRVMKSTDGYITVVYRDQLGLLTRIEKLRLPQHLPKETIPVGGLVINLTELPWEPSINPVDVEEEEVDDKQPSNNDYQGLNEGSQ